MNIILKDGTNISAIGVYRTYDVFSGNTSLSIELPASAYTEEFAENDFSEITLERPGHQEIFFNGYRLTNISESYDDRSTNVSMNLVKDESQSV